MLERSDLMVLIEGWEKSNGAKGELRRARELGKPVYVFDEYMLLPTI